MHPTSQLSRQASPRYLYIIDNIQECQVISVNFLTNFLMIIQLINIFCCSSIKSRDAELLKIKKVYSFFNKISDALMETFLDFTAS